MEWTGIIDYRPRCAILRGGDVSFLIVDLCPSEIQAPVNTKLLPDVIGEAYSSHELLACQIAVNSTEGQIQRQTAGHGIGVGSRIAGRDIQKAVAGFLDVRNGVVGTQCRLGIVEDAPIVIQLKSVVADIFITLG